MKVRNCLRCGKLFADTGRPYCADCLKEDQAEFEAVRSYLKEHPSASVVEVAQETGVSSQKIFDYVRQGRLVLNHPAVEDLACERCGEPIVTGRFCDRCARRMAAEFRGVSGGGGGLGSARGQRVHIADRVRRR